MIQKYNFQFTYKTNCDIFEVNFSENLPFFEAFVINPSAFDPTCPSSKAKNTNNTTTKRKQENAIIFVYSHETKIISLANSDVN